MESRAPEKAEQVVLHALAVVRTRPAISTPRRLGFRV